MELLAIEESKLTYLTVVQRLKGQLFRPLAGAQLAERYLFQAVPTTLEELNANPISFAHGYFKDSAIENLKLYNDGVVITAASNTSVLESFLEDLFEWMGDNLGLSEVEPLKNGKLYQSDLIVHIDIDAERLVPWASETEKLLSQKWKGYGRQPVDFRFGQTGLLVDRTAAGVLPVGFVLERRSGVPFEKNVYFSSAPLTTADHLEVLDHLERSLSR